MSEDNRSALVALLSNYSAFDTAEEHYRKETLDFVFQNDQCFERSLQAGHITGSAWIVNPGKTHVLLIHHYKLDKWFQPGGHCDGDSNVLNVAVKEALEETGLRVNPVSGEIFDIDNHMIPARNEVPEHIHYDIRFLCVADMKETDLPTNHETRAVRWVALNEVINYTLERSVLRMVEKTSVYRPN